MINYLQRDGWRQLCFGWLNLVLTAPSVYLWLGLPLVLRQHGWSGVELGIFQLAALPAALKFLLAAPIERRSKTTATALAGYRWWAIALCLLFAGTLLLIGRQPLLGSRGELFALSFGAALLATWADVPVNALAIRLLPETQRLRAGGIRSAALALGAIVGGGLMLLAHTQWGWRAPFWIMALGLLLAAAALLCLPIDENRQVQPAQVASNTQSGMDWRGYFTQPGGGRWSVLLLLCFPVIGAAWFYLKPLMLDHGFAASQVAVIVGIGGGIVAALGGMLTPWCCRRIGVANALPAVTVLCLLALGALVLVVQLQASAWWFAGAAMLVALAMGSMAAVAFGLMMYFARPLRSAGDYGIQASLFAIGRILVPLLGGIALDRFGYGGMLCGLWLAMLLVLALTLNSRRVIGTAMQGGAGAGAAAVSG